jgi:predicted transcriptional regulator of viral defense system
MPGLRYTQLAQYAAENYGYVSGEDARRLGVPMGTLNALARRGQLEHVAHGIYRVPLIPSSAMDEYMLATLWPSGRGRISHESALGLFDMSDANPAKIHVTVPASYRTHRNVPALYVLHHEDLEAIDEANFEGIPVVSPAKAVRQARARHVRRSLLEQAIDDGVRGGWLHGGQADELRAEVRNGTGR